MERLLRILSDIRLSEAADSPTSEERIHYHLRELDGKKDSNKPIIASSLDKPAISYAN